MKRKDLVNMYKTDRSIKESFKLNDDENYLIDKLYEAISVTRCCTEFSGKIKRPKFPKNRTVNNTRPFAKDK
jgi:hypothetical protein